MTGVVLPKQPSIPANVARKGVVPAALLAALTAQMLLLHHQDGGAYSRAMRRSFEAFFMPRGVDAGLPYVGGWVGGLGGSCFAFRFVCLKASMQRLGFIMPDRSQFPHRTPTPHAQT